MNSSAIHLTVDAISIAEANRLTTELEQWLKSRVENIELKRKKEHVDTQDAGTILQVILAAPSLVALAQGPALELAKGVADWLRKRRATITISADGSFKGENIRADDVERVILAALQSHAKNEDRH